MIWNLLLISVIASVSLQISQRHKFQFVVEPSKLFCFSEQVHENIQCIIELRLGHNDQKVEILMEKMYKEVQDGVQTIYQEEKKVDHKYLYTPSSQEQLHICIHNLHSLDPTYVTFSLETGHFAGDQQAVLQKQDSLGVDKQVGQLEILVAQVIYQIQSSTQSFYSHTHTFYYYVYIYSALTILFAFFLAIFQNYWLKKTFIKKKII